MASPQFLQNPSPTWVFLGDSITEDPHGYVSLCRARVQADFPDNPFKIVNSGIGGNKARDMVARFERDVLSHQPNIVSISVGVNDVWHGYYDFEKEQPLPSYDSSRGEDMDAYRNDLGWMARHLLDHRVTTIFLSPTMIGEDRDTRENKMLEDYISAMKEVAASYKAHYCPMNESLWSALFQMRKAEPSARLTTDGVHMNELGAAAMADAVLATLSHRSRI